MYNWNQANNASLTFLLYIKDPIDCESDPCHLAWLLRDNRDLMGPIYRATCSNGTEFENLDPNAFANCPVTNVWFIDLNALSDDIDLTQFYL